MLRMLWNVIVALFVLFVMRLFFAAARRATNRGPSRPGAGGGTSPRATEPGTASRRAQGKPRPPRIDRSTAEDVPFVEVKAEGASRR